MTGPRLSIIPARACTDPALKPRDLQVLCVLGRHTDDLGWCRRSQVRMADEIGCARSTVFESVERLVAAGYLHKADTLAALAQQLGLDAQTLSKTVARYNRDAAQGVDREFAKGGNSYNRAMGDPGHQPDACNAPLLSAPFYAIKLYTGDLGTSRGLVTTADAQVVNTEGHPIPGLYAVGNDMDSLMAGTYPGPGITLGPGLTFGYLAACHLAQHSPH